MNTRHLFLVPLLTLYLAGCSEAEQSRSSEPTSQATPSALEAAHEAYLRSDWLTMNDRLRDVLVDRGTSVLARENAFELLDKSYEATNGKLPSRFVYPKGFQQVNLGSKRGLHPFSIYRSIYLYVRLDKGLGTHVTDISVRTQPGNLPVLDRASGIGKFTLYAQAEKEADELVLTAEDVTEALPDGVTAIRVALDDGRAIDTWVIARGLSSSAAPEVASPTQAATFADPNPTLEWRPFHSPEWAPFEDSTLQIWVTVEKSDQPVFARWVFQPGDLAKMKIEPKLAPGNYWFALGAGEERSFGPIRLVRASQRGVQFSVLP